ncbi:MAG: helix-hairpin-helix domain-containing protein [Planctomycetales bacterium]|nr:helix-hairpin-helix domain-containing protein [Planctomycetales bacterium]
MRNTQPIAEKSQEAQPRRQLIGDRDQGTLLVVVSCSLAMIGCYWWYHGGQRGELINIDRAPPLQARYQVDINKAEWPEIIQLPGLGKTLAQRILNDRELNGEFRELEDLQRVSGIGPRTLERIRPFLLPIPKDTDWAGVDDSQAESLQ